LDASKRIAILAIILLAAAPGCAPATFREAAGQSALSLATPPGAASLSAPPSETPPASGGCGQQALPASFAVESLMIDGGGPQALSAQYINQLSNVDGDVKAQADTIGNVLNIQGSFSSTSRQIGQVANIAGAVCVQAQAFAGVVQNNPGSVDLFGLVGATDLAFLPQINNVGSATLTNVNVNNAHDFTGDLTVVNGGTITEIANVSGNISLDNTYVVYMHGVDPAKILLKNGAAIASFSP
jgi:hypothetical protein